MDETIIRRADEAEYPRILALQTEVFCGEQDIPEEIIASFLSNGPTCWVAERDGRIVGSIAAWTENGETHLGRFAVIPELRGKMTGMSFRVPTNDVSVVDLTAQLKTKTSYEEICDAIEYASRHAMKGIIEYNTDEIVSTDLRGNFHTCIFDVKAGIMLDDSFVKLIAWYDNEWGYSNQCIDLVQYAAREDLKKTERAAKQAAKKKMAESVVSPETTGKES